MRERGSRALHTLQMTAAVLCAAVLYFPSPASAQWACTTAVSGSVTCTNSGPNGAGESQVTTATGATITETNSGSNTGDISALTEGANSNITQTNSGSNTGDISALTEGANSNITLTNSGSNSDGIVAQTLGAGSSLTLTNSGSNSGGIAAQTEGVGSSITQTNSGSNTGIIAAQTEGVGSSITQINSGSNTGGLAALTIGVGSSITQTNSGSNPDGIAALTVGTNSPITQTNSGSNTGGIAALTEGPNSPITLTNSGSNSGSISALTLGANSPITLTNSGTTSGGVSLEAGNSTATLTNIVGGRVIGPISMVGTSNTVNFQGGNWLFTIAALGPTAINTNGAPFVVAGSFAAGTPIAVLDATTFALADRSLMNFTGEVSEMLQGRFDGMAAPGAGGAGALGFAGTPDSPIADQAQAAFSGIPSVAMSYASNPQPVIGKAASPAVPYYDTTIWVSGFGGERHQRADGLVLPTDDWAYGGAMGVDRVFGPNLRLGAFVGGGAGREAVELNVQTIDSTYVFGGGYGRFDWATQYLDFALYGGGTGNNSTRQVANNTVASGLETATANYGGWFISPELTYGYRIPFNAVTVTPRVRLRYVGGELDGYSETGSMQNLSVARRSINDIEERGEVEFSTVSGGFKGTASIGVIGLERLGNPTINTVLLSQNLSFTTPGQASAVGGVLGLGVQYRALPNVKLFLAGEGTVMSDKSDSFAATGGAQVSF